jgi:hypothetical protein
MFGVVAVKVFDKLPHNLHRKAPVTEGVQNEHASAGRPSRPTHGGQARIVPGKVHRLRKTSKIF